MASLERVLQTQLPKPRHLLLVAAAAAGLSACGSSGTAGQSTVVVNYASGSQAAPAAVAPAPTGGARKPARIVAAVTATRAKASPSSAKTGTSAAPASAAPASGADAAPASATTAPALSATTPASAGTRVAAGAAKATAAAHTAHTAQPAQPVVCLTEARLQQVRTLPGGEWSGATSAGTVIVLGPYKNSGAAAGAAQAVSGVRGGDYVVHAGRAGQLTGVVDTVASCLGPGTSAYTF